MDGWVDIAAKLEEHNIDVDEFLDFLGERLYEIFGVATPQISP